MANGASDLLVEIFGAERGRHARSAIGMGALPFGDLRSRSKGSSRRASAVLPMSGGVQETGII